MTRLNTSKARSEFGKVLKRVARRGDRIVLHRRGKDVAALVCLEDLELLERVTREIEDRLDNDAADEALKDPRRIPWGKVKKDLGLA